MQYAKILIVIKSLIKLAVLRRSVLRVCGPISASLRPGNTVSDLTDQRFEPQTFRSRNEHVTARPTGRLSFNCNQLRKQYFTLTFGTNAFSTVNQIFHYTCCITPNRVTSLRGPSPRHCDCGQHSSFRNIAAAASRRQQCIRFDRPEI